MKAALRAFLYVLSCTTMIVSLAMLLLTATLLSSQVALNLHVAPLALAITRALPAPLSFWGVLSSPLGGVFRTDFVLVALALFLTAKFLRFLGKRVK